MKCIPASKQASCKARDQDDTKNLSRRGVTKLSNGKPVSKRTQGPIQKLVKTWCDVKEQIRFHDDGHELEIIRLITKAIEADQIGDQRRLLWVIKRTCQMAERLDAAIKQKDEMQESATYFWNERQKMFERNEELETLLAEAQGEVIALENHVRDLTNKDESAKIIERQAEEIKKLRREREEGFKRYWATRDTSATNHDSHSDLDIADIPDDVRGHDQTRNTEEPGDDATGDEDTEDVEETKDIDATASVGESEEDDAEEDEHIEAAEPTEEDIADEEVETKPAPETQIFEQQQKIAELHTELKKKHWELLNMERQQTNFAETKAALASAREQNDKVSVEIDDLRCQHESSANTLQSRSDEITSLKEQLKAAADTVKEARNAAYDQGYRQAENEMPNRQDIIDANEQLRSQAEENERLKSTIQEMQREMHATIAGKDEQIEQGRRLVAEYQKEAEEFQKSKIDEVNQLLYSREESRSRVDSLQQDLETIRTQMRTEVATARDDLVANIVIGKKSMELASNAKVELQTEVEKRKSFEQEIFRLEGNLERLQSEAQKYRTEMEDKLATVQKNAADAATIDMDETEVADEAEPDPSSHALQQWKINRLQKSLMNAYKRRAPIKNRIDDKADKLKAKMNELRSERDEARQRLRDLEGKSLEQMGKGFMRRLDEAESECERLEQENMALESWKLYLENAEKDLTEKNEILNGALEFGMRVASGLEEAEVEEEHEANEEDMEALAMDEKEDVRFTESTLGEALDELLAETERASREDAPEPEMQDASDSDEGEDDSGNFRLHPKNKGGRLSTTGVSKSRKRQAHQRLKAADKNWVRSKYERIQAEGARKAENRRLKVLATQEAAKRAKPERFEGRSNLDSCFAVPSACKPVKKEPEGVAVKVEEAEHPRFDMAEGAEEEDEVL